MNHAEVVEEDKRNKLPTNWEAKQRRVEWEKEETRKRKVSWFSVLPHKVNILCNGTLLKRNTTVPSISGVMIAKS